MSLNWSDLKAVEKKVWLAVLVAALGYFVDIYDLLLFSIVRVTSLKDLGFTEADLLSKGVLLINIQMAGLLIGGVLWGILGDRKGRLSVLFGSIIMYSSANLLNGFVQNIEQYAILRFIAGVGLAGELGAGITLISELLPKNVRGFGTTFVASIGILGAVFGAFMGDMFAWRVAYMIGGGMGFLILLLRVGVTESGMFHKVKEATVERGNFLMLFATKARLIKFVSCIVIGIPIWYVVGIFLTFAPEFGKAFGMTELPTGGDAVMYGYIGLSLGDLSSGLMSQWLQSRRRAIFLFLAITVVGVAAHLLIHHTSTTSFYSTCVVMGFGVGYWCMFVQVAAEQFGTNIRSTVTTSVPNFVRGAVIPLTASFQWALPHFGAVGTSVIIGIVTLVITLAGLFALSESFHKDLDYEE
ncbi:MFS transporter [soil metagenome]